MKNTFGFFLPWFFPLVLSAFVVSCIAADKYILLLIGIAFLGIGVLIPFLGLSNVLLFLYITPAFVSIILMIGFIYDINVHNLLTFALIMYSIPVFLPEIISGSIKMPFFFVPTAVMLLGYICSNIYLILNRNQISALTFAYDIKFILGIFSAFFFYFLLCKGIISIRRLVFFLSLSGLIFLMYIIYQYFKSNTLSAMFNLRFGWGTSISPNIIACVMDLTFPLTLFLAFSEKKILYKVALLIISFFYCAVILMTYSRGSIFGLLAIAIFFIFYKRSLHTFFITSSIAIFFAIIFGGKLIQRIMSTNIEDILSNLWRMELYKSVFRILKQLNFFFGIGMNGFSQEKFNYGFPQGLDVSKAMSAHNHYFEIWVDWGLFGLVGWILLLIGALIVLARCKLTIQEQVVRKGLFFSILSFLLHGFVDSAIANDFVLFLFFAIIGCSSYLYSVYKTRESAEKNIHSIELPTR